ncbi:DUF4389 domain-containing protein [Parasphingorhabdus pacifica]
MSDADPRSGAGGLLGPEPLEFSVAFPERQLDRVGTAFRLILVIPIGIVLGTVSGATVPTAAEGRPLVVAGGLLFLPPLLMILFRRKYPRWWFEWNRELLRFTNRVLVYMALLDDRYPSTDEQQAVRLDLPVPDGGALNRWLPLVKWLLVLPHVIILVFLDIAATIAVVIAWFAILFTGRYPQGAFDFVVGVIRWHNRVIAYAAILVTDRYPPFRLGP